jgi:hypothetical protein
MKQGLFELIRKTSFTKFFVSWLISIFIFALIYFLLSPISALIIASEPIIFTFNGLIHSIYGSFLIATVLGLGTIIHAGLITILVYIQLILSIIIILVLADKIIQKYVHPHYHATHSQDKKINSLMLTMSIFRNHIDKITHEYTSKKRTNIEIKEIESVIDGLYVAFLDIEKTFSSRNIHRHKIKNIQYLMLTENIEDSLDKLLKFLLFLEKHDAEWRDKSTEFWMNYILETADRITLNLEDDKLKTPAILIAIENIREYTEKIRQKL